MTTTVFSLFYAKSRVNNFATNIKAQVGKVLLHYFPDNECCVQICTDIDEQNIIIFDNLYDPNKKILPLLLLAETARELGAKKVTLVAPYLAYMRQDTQFKAGEGVSAKYFAQLISQYFDHLITIDPHLHRFQVLEEIYTIPTQVLHAGHLVSNWIVQHVADPILIGPDSESKQWIKAIAEINQVPYIILNKIRYGDKQVDISIPELGQFATNTPVLIDDIISSGHTMIETVRHINRVTKMLPVCIGIHGIFAQDSYNQLQQLKVQKIITCNTIEHFSNKIDIDTLFIDYML